VRTLYRYRVGDIRFDEAKQELVVGGLTVEVQPRPLAILSLLLSRAGQAVTHEELFEKLWAKRYASGNTNALANAITKLRNALGINGPNLIENVPRIGYRFTGQVERTTIAKPLVTKLDLDKGKIVPLRGDFILERILSQSAGREVWLAVHRTSSERRVYKFAASQSSERSLKREVTLARLLHDALGERSDLIRIVGWNFDQSPCFLESAFGGENLLTWATAGNNLANATPSERLTLLLQIADAVSAAHNVTVLHGDIKPENVLVGSRDGILWQVRIMDFGSGRLLEPERLAELGITSLGMTATEALGNPATRGTLMYLAPELLQEQPVTVKSDLYALGVLLYQLMAGDLRLPLGPGWERNIADELLREDIAKAVDTDPELRAANVKEWTASLRQLERRRTQRMQEQAVAKQAQIDREALHQAKARRPWVIATMATLGAGLVVALLLYGSVRRSRHELSSQYAVAQALNSFLIQNFIAVANPATTGRKDVTVIEAAHKAADDIDAVFANADARARGGLHAAMQEAFSGLSEFDASLSEGHKALDALLAVRPQDWARIAEVRIRMADGLTESSKLDEAATQLDGALAIIHAEHLEDSAIAARYWWARAGIEIDRLDMPHAVQDYRHAWELAQRHAELPPNTRDSMEYLYADALRMSNSLDEAEREANALLARQTARLGAEHPLTCHTNLLLASIYGYMKRMDRAISMAEQAANCLVTRLGPTNIRTVSAYFVLGDVQFEAEHYDEAALAYDKAADSYTSLLGARAQRSINQRTNAAVARQYAGHFGEAEKELATTLETARAALGWTHPTVQELRYHLADCRLDQHRANSVGELIDALSPEALNEAEIEPDWDGRLAYEKGRLALFSGDAGSAIPLLETAVRIIGEKNPDGRVTKADIERLIQEARQGTARNNPLTH
jgi:non-specific serine/threonine protein kinase